MGEGIGEPVQFKNACLRPQVAVNGAHLLEYKHKIPLNRVDTFSISGNVRVHAIGYIPNSVSTFPSRVCFVITSWSDVFVFSTYLINHF